jgi:hypothetical protein
MFALVPVVSRLTRRFQNRNSLCPSGGNQGLAEQQLETGMR